MKREMFLFSILATSATAVMAASVPSAAGNTALPTATTPLDAPAPDSLRLNELTEVVVRSVKAGSNAPFAIANVDRAHLAEHATTGRELPFLLQMTPSVVASSDGGLGIGTGYLRIRGSVDSRINVTLDGVPLNSPEDQAVFWANMNSYAASLSGVQIQRGVGTSTCGDGAFGATVALTSAAPTLTPEAELTCSAGSYGTVHLTGSASSGLLWDHLIIDGRYSTTRTDGYMDCTGSESGSYYGGLTWIGDNLVIRYKHLGNYETTDQAWDGVANAMYDAGYHKFNSLNEYQAPDGSMVKYPVMTTDNFWQNHNILTAALRLDDHFTTTATLRYTHGHGYYINYKPNYKLNKFGLTDPNLTKTDFVRRKGLTQDQWGAQWHLAYRNKRWDAIGGVAMQYFDGNHYGYLTYAKGMEHLLKEGGRYHYYDSDASKFDYSIYAKGTYAITPAWSAYADLQYRSVTYKTDGLNDKFIEAADGTYHNQRLDVDELFNFFNPKAGISYKQGGHNAYASVAVAHREPARNNYTDNGNSPLPRHESLTDYELGYAYTATCFHAGVNLYFMDYDNQLVQTGAVSDIGEPLTSNIKTSYRLGAELTAGVTICRGLNLEANAALSQNKAKDYDEVVEDWEAASGYRTIHHNSTRLGFSPEVTANGMLTYTLGGLSATWHTGYVGRQYLDNSDSRDRSLDAYTVSNLRVSYTLKCHKVRAINEVVFGAQVNNLFDERYCANGWTYSAVSESAGYTENQRYTEIGYFPMAGTTAMGTITIRY